MIFTPPSGGVVRSADTDVSDLTSAKRAGDAHWVDETTIEIPFDPEPTDAEQELIVRRLLTRDGAEETAVCAMQAVLDSLTETDPLTTAVRLLLNDRLGRLDPMSEETS